MRVAIIASGEGTTLQSIIDAVEAKRLAAVVGLVICNNRDAGALARADAAGIPRMHLSGLTHPDPTQLDDTMCAALLDHRIDVVVLAGYMKRVGSRTLSSFFGRILNTHPSLLPRHGGRGMYGRRVHEAVLASGDLETGVSVHIVDGEYDTGPVIAQIRMPVPAQTTVEALERAVQELERQILCNTLQEISVGHIALGSDMSIDTDPELQEAASPQTVVVRSSSRWPAMASACDSVDHPGWLTLRQQLWPHCSREEHLAEMSTFLEFPERFGQFVQCDGSGKPLGFVEVAVRTDYVNGTDSSPVAFLEGIFVVPKARRKGAARALVAAASSWARARGCLELASDADLGNTESHAMHAALGFEETERVVFFKRVL